MQMKKLINLIFLAWVCIAPQTYAMRISGGWLVRYVTTANYGSASQVVSMVFIPDNSKVK